MINNYNAPGILPNSTNYALTPSEDAKRLFLYPTWCGHYYCTTDYYFKRDYFPPILIVFVREGLLHVEYRDLKFDAGKGDVVLLDCTEPHYYHAREGLEFLYMHFDGTNAHEICQYILERTGPWIRQASNVLVGRELYNMVEFYRHDGIENMIHTAARINRIVGYLLTLDRAQYMNQKEDPIEHAIRYIRNNVGKDISLEELAEKVHLSTYYFAHCFKQETGFAPMEYIINTRLERAKVLLVQTRTPIGEIAYEVGYSSNSSFNNMFVKRAGMSPRQYRQTYQATPEDQR